MISSKTLKQSLILSHIFTGLLPLAFIALFILLFIVKTVREDFHVRVGMLSEGTRGQIQLFMGQPLSVLRTIGIMLQKNDTPAEVQSLLDSYLRDSVYFDLIYLLDSTGTVINAGLPAARERQRLDLLGINLGHKKEFRDVLRTGLPQWSDTFLSLSSGKTSLTLYVPAGTSVLAADINLDELARLITKLSSEEVMTAVIDRNGAIIIHPDPTLMGSTIMLNEISLVADALQGIEGTGEFNLNGERYLGSTSIIEPTKWICLFAEPVNHLAKRLFIVLLIFTGGICGAAGLSLILALYKARGLATPIAEITNRTAVIAHGEYTVNLPESSFAELDLLAESINKMAHSIKTRESQLRESELKYRELIETTSNLVIRLNKDLSIAYANHTVERLTGLTADQAVGRSFIDVVVPDDRPILHDAARSWTHHESSGAPLEIRVRHQDSSIRHLLLTANIHVDDRDLLTDISIIGHDITARLEFERQRHEMEQQRQQSQKMELLGLMAGGVAHDLNNILAGIINYPELLLIKLAPDSPLRPNLEAIKRSGERAAAVVADLLTVARGSAAVHDVVDLNELLRSMVSSPEFISLQEHHANVDFTFLPFTAAVHCRCSPVHIEKAVMNLIMNGFEAVESVGRVELGCSIVDQPEQTGKAADLPGGQFALLRVTDTGKGIDPVHLKKIFEPFFSKKRLGRSGTGLGLTVAWSTIKEHGGMITVTSSENGSIFSVYLPITEEQTTRTPVDESLTGLRGNGETVLVIDDEEHLRNITVNMLEVLNYRATAAAGGEEALAYLDRTPVDLLLLDMQMAPGISGRETYSRVCQRNPNQRALIISGFSTSDDVEATLAMGASALLKKPYSLIELGQAVHKILTAP